MACNHNCSGCSVDDCNKREPEKLKTVSENRIKKIVGIISGKGGVGKSSVTSLLAVAMAKKGYKVGIMDADITGPSIPKAFGLTEMAYGNEQLIFPAVSKLQIKVISINLLLDEPTKPVLWRGPVIGNAVSQFYTNVLWEDLDYLFIDMPPGTGDVALTVFQSLPIDGTIIVSTPQDLVAMIVGKAVHMCNLMNVKMYGLIENMSYIECPHCKEALRPFGPSKLPQVAAEYNIKELDCLPLSQDLTSLMDSGLIEEADTDLVKISVELLEKELKN